MDLGDVGFEVADVEVVLGDSVDFELGLFLLFGFLDLFARLALDLFLFALPCLLLI